ncbi:MAG: hypothetical protein H5T43_04580 [Methanomethylovorans sp.]|jgi:hypothetical protein|nr:hypothetical protein [Methanomethylovorans sp.]
MDESGQITLDYLVGITIFLLALVFLFQYAAGLFMPFESTSDEVTMIADRVAATVVEDWISAGDPHTSNIVCSTFMEDFFTQLNTNYIITQNSLGLNGTFFCYDLNVSLENSTKVISCGGKNLPHGGNIGQTKRIVLVEDSRGNSYTAILSFRVW